jgi:hypothetical protein
MSGEVQSLRSISGELDKSCRSGAALITIQQSRHVESGTSERKPPTIMASSHLIASSGNHLPTRPDPLQVKCGCSGLFSVRTRRTTS